ncbi:MAG: hypothetical protein ACE5DM_03870 [Candidatus Nanoarchaeia archaeon]
MKTAIVVMMLVIATVLVGCAKAPTGPAAPVAPAEMPAAPADTKAAVDGITEDLSAIDDLEADLNMSDLDSLEQDLDI